MKRLAHISDLHFGTEEPGVTAALVHELAAQHADLVVVSGDLTQRARRDQFAAARDYLSRLPRPQLIVPGNHDIPLFDLATRFAAPLHRYRTYVSPEIDPVWRDADACVVGLNTARSLTWKGGRISVAQITRMRAQLTAAPAEFRVVVTHHPFIPPPGDEGIELVGRAARAVTVLDECEVDLVLAGHLHRGYAGDIKTHYPAAQRAVIAVQAGTAISSRVRGREPNAYNLLHFSRGVIAVEVRIWDGQVFSTHRSTVFRKHANGWAPDPPATG